MGEVWMAEQTEPIRRRVAVKIVKPGLDSRQVLARFEAERQALALMDHPNIARVLDAGSTSEGRPYFVMELVKGVPLTQFCDERDLAIPERLELFTAVCQGIQHAHQKGVIHRDIKPSNVLVALYDGIPVPKVIDFGIAKAMGQQLTEKTVFTKFGAVVGTLEYMSPEQAELNQLDIDTRSDIYSLGVLLYELLTGSTPLGRETLQRVAFDEVLRRIRTEEAPRPSVRLGEIAGRPRDGSSLGRRDSWNLSRRVRGDLDWIAMKALEKDRARRYETASGLAADVRRHLSNEPVAAGPPTAAYRLRKLLRKHRVAVGVAAGFLAVLMAATGVSLWWSVQARQERDVAMRAERAAKEARQEAEARALAEARAKREAEVHRKNAENALGLLRMQQAESFFAAGNSAGGLAQLAGVLERDPSNRLAAERILSVLSHRALARPAAPPVQLGARAVSAEFSPDRGRVAMAFGTSAQVWDIKTGTAISGILAHPDPVWAAEFSPDGGRVITVSGREARIWDVRTSQEVVAPLVHSAEISSARFSPDGLRVLTITRDRETTEDDFTVTELGAAWVFEGIRVTNSPAAAMPVTRRGQGRLSIVGETPARPFKNEDRVESAQFSPDGRRLATVSASAVRVWDAASSDRLSEIPRQDDPFALVQFSPDGSRLATVAGRVAQIWDPVSGALVAGPLVHASEVRFVQFSPDARSLVSASADGRAQVWDLATGSLGVGFAGHEGEVISAQYSADGQRVLTVSLDKTARVWESSSGRLLVEPIRHERRILCARFGAVGGDVLIATEDGVALAWSAENRRRRNRLLRHPAAVRSAAFSADGLRAMTVCEDRMVRLWNCETGWELARELRHRAEVNTAVFSSDGRWLVTASSDQEARVWDVQTGQAVPGRMTHRGAVLHAAFRPDGEQLVTASLDREARVWETRTARLVAALVGHRGGLLWARFSPDGRRIATASSDRTARLWDASTGGEQNQLRHDDDVFCVEFSPDGRRVATASRDRTARIWDAEFGRLLAEPCRHEGMVRSIEFSADGNWILTAASDGTARVWNARTGRARAEPLRHSKPVRAAHFSPDGLRVLTASEDKTIRVWDAETGTPLSESLEQGGTVVDARYSPDGFQVIAASEDRYSYVWEIPTVAGSVPAWLADLATAVAGRRLGESGAPELVPAERFLQLSRQLSESQDSDLLSRWAREFCGNGSEKPPR